MEKYLTSSRVFRPTLLSCSTAYCVLYNTNEHVRCFFIYANKEASTVLCSVVKHLRSDGALNKL